MRAGAWAGLVLSLVFGLLFTALQTFDLFVDSWTPRAGEPARIALRVPYGPRIVEAARDEGPATAYGHARIIIPPHTTLDARDETHRAAIAYEALRRPPGLARLIALFAIYSTLGMLLATYLRRFGQSRMRLLRTQIGLFLLLLFQMCMVKGLLLFTGLPELWVPVSAVPLWVALSFDRRSAFLVTLVAAFLAASLLRFDLVMLIVVLVRGMAASLLYFDKKHPRKMLPAGALAGLFASVVYIAVAIVFEGSFDLGADLARPLESMLVATMGGGVMGGICAVLVRDPAERILGVVSRDKLHDLTDLEQPLLKKMAAEAPGSWEHARAMANLAEAAASAIGADALLTRVGAYYHDLGKTIQPKLFIENLLPGEKSPHDDMDPEESAAAIRAHVIEGTRLLREGNIPEPVVEFAYTHHGTQLVEYFWHKCLERGNPKNLTEDDFRYPGMKPQTKETAILMLVDSIEAASRTIDPPEQAKFEEMIQRIVFTKLKSGQLDESGLTLEDLRVLVVRMSETLVNVYHSRIRYPWQQSRASLAQAGESR